MGQPSCLFALSCAHFTSEPVTVHHSEKSLPTTAAAAMEMSFCSSLQLQDNSFLFDCESLLDKSLAPDPASDLGYFSAASSLSPTSSVDSFCFSPASLQAVGNEQDGLGSFLFSSPVEPPPARHTQTLPCSRSSSEGASTTKKSRSRYPGKKRQTASEREKLRMRDLTKAMHHLRAYLPPSVAPAGTTLTKIETLRLAIRYISCLSAQLGLSEEVLEQRRSSQLAEQVQTLCHFPDQPPACHDPRQSSCHAVSTERLPSPQQPYQVSGGVCFSSEQYWELQQQPQTFTDFSGRC